MDNKRQQTAASLMFAPNQKSIQILEGSVNSLTLLDNDKMRMTALSVSLYCVFLLMLKIMNIYQWFIYYWKQ